MVLRVRPPYLLEFVVAMAVCAFVAACGGLPRIPAADQYARRAGSRQHDLIRNAPIPWRSHEASGPSATTRTQAACRPAASGQRGESGGRSQIAAPRQLGGNAGDRTRRRGNAGPGGQAAGAPGGEALPAPGGSSPTVICSFSIARRRRVASGESHALAVIPFPEQRPAGETTG
jgi:hypothetical protein